MFNDLYYYHFVELKKLNSELCTEIISFINARCFLNKYLVPDDKKHIACEKVRFICQFHNTKLIWNKRKNLFSLFKNATGDVATIFFCSSQKDEGCWDIYTIVKKFLFEVHSLISFFFFVHFTFWFVSFVIIMRVILSMFNLSIYYENSFNLIMV